jgi:GT2 family glycosyltransferase
MSKPLVSIIIVNWNDAKWLRDCLASLFQSDYPNVEIIVVDNGSTDDSVVVVRNEFPTVQLIENGKNLGFAQANNIGIRASKGRYCVLLNADTKVEPGWLRPQVELCESDAKVGMCQGKMMLMREPGKLNSAGMYLLPNGLTRHVGDGEEDRGQYDQVRPIFGVSGACAFCRREMLDQIGLLDEDFFAYYEDTDWSWRAWLLGWKCLYLPAARLHHYRNVTTDQNQSLYWHYRYLNQRNRLWMWIKNASWGTLLRYAPWLFAYDVVMTGKGLKAALTRSRPPVELQARWDALRGLGKMLRKRRALQRARVTPDAEIRKLMLARCP